MRKGNFGKPGRKSFLGAARGVELALGWVSMAPLVLPRTGLTKCSELPFTGSWKSRMGTAEGKVGSLPSQGFFSTGSFLCPSRGHSWSSLAWLFAEVPWVFVFSAPWTSKWAGLGNNKRLGNVLHWCTNSCVSVCLSAPDSWTQDGGTHTNNGGCLKNIL